MTTVTRLLFLCICCVVCLIVDGGATTGASPVVVDSEWEFLMPHPHSSRIALSPTHPMDSDDIVVTLMEEYPTSCVPSCLPHSVERRVISINLESDYDPGRICAFVITPIYCDAHIGQLPGGIYTVNVTLNGVVRSPAAKQFTVLHTDTQLFLPVVTAP